MAIALREQRDWSQGDLGDEVNKPQSAISRIEDPDYGKLTVKTLFDLAKAFDVAVLVQFVEWPEWLNRMEDVSTASLEKKSFDGEELVLLSSIQFPAPSAATIFAPPGVVGVGPTGESVFVADESFFVPFEGSTPIGGFEGQLTTTTADTMIVLSQSKDAGLGQSERARDYFGLATDELSIQ